MEFVNNNLILVTIIWWLYKSVFELKVITDSARKMEITGT